MYSIVSTIKMLTSTRRKHLRSQGDLVITLSTGGQSVCGSSIIISNRCVTAAHCWRHGNTQARQFVVVLGSVTLFSGGTRIATTNLQMHASYNQNNLQNDIAIIVIGSVGFNNNVRAIGLASGTNTFAGSWGELLVLEELATEQINLPLPDANGRRVGQEETKPDYKTVNAKHRSAVNYPDNFDAT